MPAHIPWIAAAACFGLWVVIRLRLRWIEKVVPCLDSANGAPPAHGPLPLVSIIVPARNEEKTVAACVRSILAQDYPLFEVLVVDDESSDRTAEVAEAALAGDGRGRFLRGAPRPSERWVGKTWAVTQGCRAARGDWLLFVDGDVVLHPTAARLAVQRALETGVDVVSILPAIESGSVWENLVMPLFALLSALMQPPDHANRLESSASRLSGAFLLIRREAYVAVGGHEAVRREILEDMALAESMKRSGRPVCLAYTHDLASTHLYATFREMWEGLTRIGYPMLGYSPPRLLGAYLAAVVGTLVPWLLMGQGAWLAAAGQPGPGLVPALLGLVLFEFQVRSTCIITDHIGLRPGFCYLLPLASAMMCMAATRSAYRYYTRQGLKWKQRICR